MPSSENPNQTQITTMRDFPGLVLNADPREVPAGGGQQQVNIVCERVGELATRRGVRIVTFDGE